MFNNLIEHNSPFKPKSSDELLLDLKNLSQYDKNVIFRNKCKEGDAKYVKLLLDAGANVHFNEDSPLIFACNCGHTEVVKLLLNAGANIDINGSEPLLIACDNGYVNLFNLLIKSGSAIPDMTLIYAFRGIDKSPREYLKIIKTLLNKGADVNVSNNYLIKTASKYNMGILVKWFLDAGADVHANDDEPLRLASENGRIIVVKTLLDAGANVHAKDDQALRMASRNGHTEIVKLLLDVGANVHAKENCSIIHACENGHLESVKVLLNAGAKVDQYIIGAALEYGHVEIVRLLLNYVDVNSMNSSDYKILKKFINESIILKPKSSKEIQKSLEQIYDHLANGLLDYELFNDYLDAYNFIESKESEIVSKLKLGNSEHDIFYEIVNLLEK